MPLLSRAKRKVGRALGSAAMHADAKQTEFCTYLSADPAGRVVAQRRLGLVVGRPCGGAHHGSHHCKKRALKDCRAKRAKIALHARSESFVLVPVYRRALCVAAAKF